MPKKKPKKKGRPSLDTVDVRRKIEEAAALDASAAEIAFYAGISPDTYERILARDKDFCGRIEALRQKPILKARQTVVKALDVPSFAHWYLERKARKEFRTSSEVDLTSKGERISDPSIKKEVNDAVKRFLNENHARKNTHGK